MQKRKKDEKKRRIDRQNGGKTKKENVRDEENVRQEGTTMIR